MIKEIDGDYWITGVEVPEARGSIILYLLDLMDKSYQEKEWVKEGNDISFDQEFSFSWDMILDEMCICDDLEKGEPPYRLLGYSLKTKEEAEKLYNVAYYMDLLVDECIDCDNAKYLSSEYLEPMRIAAKEAFDVFMANEKDNKEFCDWIEELKAKRVAEINSL